MAKISKLGNKHRLRYMVYFPGGKQVERSRLIASTSDAREKLSMANELEFRTANKTYTARRLEVWQNMRLISPADRAQLAEDLPGHGKTLEECLDEWEATWSVSTEEASSRNYRRNNLEGILGKDKAIKALTFHDGLGLVNELKARGRKVSYIRKHVRDLKAAFNHQLAIRYLEYNPFATLSVGRIPAEEKTRHVILTDKQIRKVLERAHEKDQEKRPLLEGTLTLHLLMFFGLGIRRREAMASRLDMINWKKRSITLPAEITKTGKPRTIGLGKRLYKELKARSKLKGKDDYILPRFTPRTISRAIGNHLRECGIKARPHDARHTYTTMLQDLGVTPHRAMERTGHTDMKMLSHYSHGAFEEVYEDKFDFMQVEKPKKKGNRSNRKKTRDRKK